MNISPAADGGAILTLNKEGKEALKQICHFWNGSKEEHEEADLVPVNAISTELEEKL